MGRVYQNRPAAAAQCARRIESLTPIVEAIENRADAAPQRSAICIADFLGVCAVGPLPSEDAAERQVSIHDWVRDQARESEEAAFEAMLESVLS